MNSIEVRGATKSYDHKNPVLNGLDLTVQTGTMLVSILQILNIFTKYAVFEYF